MTNFSGNPKDAPWTSDFMPNNARVEDGQLILTLQKGESTNKFGKVPGFGATVSSTRYAQQRALQMSLFFSSYDN